MINKLSDKETIYPLQEGRDKHGQQIFLCPRCNKVNKFNNRRIKYCDKCGQHISPAATRTDEDKENFLNNLKITDIENKK